MSGHQGPFTLVLSVSPVMPSRSFFSSLLLCAGCAATSCIDAEGSDAAGLSPELEALLEAQPLWAIESAAESSFGYKDNLLLSATADERSSFARGRAEVFVVRLHPRWNYSLFVQGEGTHYFSGETFDHDARAFGHTELAYRLSDSWKMALPVIGSYSDDVFDVSETEVDRTVAEQKVVSGRAAPTLRWDFFRRGWIEVQAAGERKRYEDRGNDARIGEGRVRLGWEVGRRFEVRAGVARRWRNFEHRLQYSSTGRERPGTHLKIQEREGELRLDATWDADRNWITVTRAVVMDYRDNGSGYFSFDRMRVTQELEWNREPWLVRLEVGAERMEWEVQTVGVGATPPARIKDGYDAALRVERELCGRWKLVAGYKWERTRSNVAIASYEVNEGLLGARWSWEK